MAKKKIQRKKTDIVFIKNEDGSEIACKSSALSEIYKYWPEPLESTFARQNLEALCFENKIRLTGPSEVNDPFDCNPVYIQDLVGNKAAADITSVLNRPATSLEFERFQQTLRSRFPNRRARRADKEFQKFVRETSEKSVRTHYDLQGFASFSSDGLNPLLWAHYADSHKGIRVTFRTSPLETLGRADELPIGSQLMEVRYTEKRPTILASRFSKQLGRGGLNDDVIIDSVLNKATQWKYESEWRFMGRALSDREPPRIGDWVDIGTNAISAITLGVCSTEETARYVNGLVEKSALKINIRRVVLSDRKFELLETNM